MVAAAQATVPDPLDAGAAVPPVQYRSAFSDYRAYDESQRTDWREANRTVDEIARKIGQGAAAAGASGKPAAPPAAMPSATPPTGGASAASGDAATSVGRHGGGHSGHGAHR